MLASALTPAELTHAREALYLSQRDLSTALGVHPTVVNRWERGHAKVPPYLHLALLGLRVQRDMAERVKT